MRNWPSEQAILLYIESTSKYNQNWEGRFLYFTAPAPYSFQICARDHVLNFIGQLLVLVSAAFLRRKIALLGRFFR